MSPKAILQTLQAMLLCFSLTPAHAGEPLATFDWRVREYVTRDGDPLGCGVVFVAHRGHRWVRFELSVHKIHPAPVHETRFEIAAGETQKGDLARETRREVRDGWLRTPGGSTAGVLRHVASDREAEYVATARGLEPFAELFRDLRQNGAVAGYRTRDASKDEIVRPGPPPKKTSDDAIRCVNRLL